MMISPNQIKIFPLQMKLAKRETAATTPLFLTGERGGGGGAVNIGIPVFTNQAYTRWHNIIC